jgi:hypothetical protein
MHIVAHARALHAEVICLTAAGNAVSVSALFQRRRYRPPGAAVPIEAMRCNARMALIIGGWPRLTQPGSAWNELNRDVVGHKGRGRLTWPRDEILQRGTNMLWVVRKLKSSTSKCTRDWKRA